MLENKPSQSIMTELLGQSLYEVWQALCTAINKKYDMEQLWNTFYCPICKGKLYGLYGNLRQR